ncbi:MAG: hypothetical protein QNJ14_10775 [Woeseiaceae bacterium]|nr:hypothetical protein [Woeseiaceae bacterium]
MNRLVRKTIQPWVIVYISLIAAYALAGPSDETPVRDTVLPSPTVVGSAPLFRKDI